MTIELIRAAGLYAGVEYAYAAVAPVGALVFTAGACPLGESGATVGPGDVRAQARQCVTNLFAALVASGAGRRDVLKTTVYVASAERTDLVAAWEEIRDAFGTHDAPSTLLGVVVLGYPDQLVELEAVAMRPSL
ncbi:RidA family protein [Actinoallomurus bryophytorum]|uniref:Enamine deaminase RidA (YjgF/YER057c/UK114 family) n=1 Tax=Actinoallomurus bryophytorum TaxID=1490222 RepID=A0A543CKC9_9ACTN|nr:RidA family protein [Actinoallomurus bryophytorum]TQL97556.1 enamine deaminase RidA (YjgF/YER057c/UK114 family) [Actinoallomurus bryophytorum]